VGGRNDYGLVLYHGALINARNIHFKPGTVQPSTTRADMKVIVLLLGGVGLLEMGRHPRVQTAGVTDLATDSRKMACAPASDGLRRTGFGVLYVQRAEITERMRSWHRIFLVTAKTRLRLKL